MRIVRIFVRRRMAAGWTMPEKVTQTSGYTTERY
jgi:hypothetical protein